MAPPAEGAKIPCPTPQHLQAELATLAAIIEPGETEESWDKIEKALIRFAGVVRGGGYKHTDAFVKAVGNKGIGLNIVDCMLSDRGRLSGAAIELVQSFAPRLGDKFQPLVYLYLPPITRLFARPNKIYIKRAVKCVETIISRCHLPTIIIYLRNGLDDRNDQCKRSSASAIQLAIATWPVQRWHEKDMDILEVCVRRMATDKDAEVRRTGKAVWGLFQETWPERVNEFVSPLTPTIRRYLDLPPAEGGPSRSRPPVSRPAFGRTGLGPSYPAHPPLSASGSSNLHRSTGSDREREPARTVPGRVPSSTSALGGGAQRTRVAAEPPERPASDLGRPRALDPLPRPAEAQGVTRSTSARALSHAASWSNLGSSSSAQGTMRSLASKPTRPTAQVTTAETASATRNLSGPRRRVPVDEDERHPIWPTSVLGHSDQAAATSKPAQPVRRATTTPVVVSAQSTGGSVGDVAALAASSSPASRSASDPTRSSSKVRERVTEIERRASEHGVAAKGPTPNRDQQLAAGIPLPLDTPVPAKPVFNSYSPSLSVLLGRNRIGGDHDLTLADLSMDPNSSDSPAPQRIGGMPLRQYPSSLSNAPAQPSQTARASLPSSVSPPVEEVIHKSAPETPVQTSVPSELQTPTPTTAPTPEARHISPLPRRATPSTPTVVQSPAEPSAEVSPQRSSKKRKGCDIADRLAEDKIATPSLFDVSPARATPFGPTAPTPAPLISFFDSPAPPIFQFRPSGSIRPRESIFNALMGLEADAPLVPQPSSSLGTASIQENDEEEEDAEVTVRIDMAAPVSPSLASAAPSVEMEDADTTAVFIGRPEAAAMERVDEPVPRLVEEPEAERLKSEPAVEQVVQDAVSEPEAERLKPETAVEQVVQEAVSQPEITKALPVAPVEPLAADHVEDHTPSSLAPATLVVPSTPLKAAPAPEQKLAVPPTPLPEVLAEFDALTEPEDDDILPTPIAQLSTAAPGGEVTTLHIHRTIAVQDTTVVTSGGDVFVQQSSVLLEMDSGPSQECGVAASSKSAASISEIATEPEASPSRSLLVDTSEPVIVSPEKNPQLEEMKEAFEEAPSVDLLKISTGLSEAPSSGSAKATATPEKASSVEASVEASTQPPVAKPKTRSGAPDERRARLGARRAHDAPVEKKSFRPVSRLQTGKTAPAPARLASRSVSATAPTASSQSKALAKPASSSSAAVTAPTTKPAGPHKPAALQIITASKPAPPVAAKTAPMLTKTTGSNLFKPTAATTARQAATAAASTALAEAKDKEAKDLLEVKDHRGGSRPVSSQGHARGAAPIAAAGKTCRPLGGVLGSTAASRAREAQLPPIKRQRLKLTAPQESFRPRSGKNMAKDSVLGSSSAVGPNARARRQVRARPGVKAAENQTFPLAGPDLRTSLSQQIEKKEVEVDKESGKVSGKQSGKEVSEEEKKTPLGKGDAAGKGSTASKDHQSKGDDCQPIIIPKRSGSMLAVPASDLDLDCGPRTPTSGVMTPGCLSPASSRHTSYTSHSDNISCGSRPSPSKLKVGAARPLDPVLTPTHSANVSAVSSSGQAALVAPVADSPAVMHARRVSGIPSSLKKTIAEEAARRKAAVATLGGSPPSTGARVMMDLAEDEDLRTPPGTMTRRRTAQLLRQRERKHHEEEPVVGHKEEYERTPLPPRRLEVAAGEGDEALDVVRHDVSTPTGKAASLLSKLNDERRALGPRDSNSRD